MNKAKYLIRRVFKMDYKRFFRTLKKLKKESGKSYIFLLFDIIYCALKYQAGYVDYSLFLMYKLNKEERDKIITSGKSNQYIRKLNPKEYWYLVDDKKKFNDLFTKYLKREYLLLNKNNYKEYEKFVRKYKKIIVKPVSATCGFGVEIIDVNKNNAKEVYENLIKNNQFLLEEVIHQHDTMSKLHKTSVNTIRIITINSNKKVTIPVAVLRIGTNNSVIDNFHNGGICCPLDLKTGRVNGNAVNAKEQYFSKHPNTGVTLQGFKIPFWKDVLKMVKNAASEIPELGLIGWDVAISKNGPCLVEANQIPAHDLYRMVKTPNNVGMVKIFDDAIKR